MPDLPAINIDPDKLTIGDLEDFEEVVGESFQQAFANGPSGVSTKALKAIVWIVSRQDNPDFTLDDARNVRVAEFSFAEPETDPTPAAGTSNG